MINITLTIFTFSGSLGCASRVCTTWPKHYQRMKPGGHPSPSWSKRMDLLAMGTRQHHHDYAPTQFSHLIEAFLAKHNFPLLHQALSCSFLLFPKLKMGKMEKMLKMVLIGFRFESWEDIHTAGYTFIQLYSNPKMVFPKCFQQWWDHREKLLQSHCEFFEWSCDCIKLFYYC